MFIASLQIYCVFVFSLPRVLYALHHLSLTIVPLRWALLLLSFPVYRGRNLTLLSVNDLPKVTHPLQSNPWIGTQFCLALKAPYSYPPCQFSHKTSLTFCFHCSSVWKIFISCFPNSFSGSVFKALFLGHWASQVRSGKKSTCQCRRHGFNP